MANKIYDILPPKEESQKVINKENNSGVLPVKIIKKEEPGILQDKTSVLQSVKSDLDITNQKDESKEKPIEFNRQIDEKFDYDKFNNDFSERKNKKIKTSFKKWAILSFCCLLFIACIYFYFSLQKVKIEIWPKTEVLNLESKITIDKSFKEINLENNLIPGQIIEIEEILWQDFPSTGILKDEVKASGSIKIYNKMNPVMPVTLIAGTRFLSDSGKYFIMQEKITIPAATFSGGKIVPGSISVKVVADDSGKDYNIGPSKFSIPKLTGTQYYYNVYAESTSQMSGGYIGESKQVTQRDLETAKESLSKKVLEVSENSLKKKITEEYVFLEKSFTNNVVEASSTAKIGSNIDNFSYKAVSRASILVLKKNDLNNFVKNKISQNLSKKVILEETIKIDFKEEDVNIKEGRAILNIKFSSKIYQSIEVKEIFSLVKNKNKLEISDIIESRFSDQIDKKDIVFWPFWTKISPSKDDKIDIYLKF